MSAPPTKLQLDDALCAELGVSPVSPNGHENAPDFVPSSSTAKPLPPGFDPALADRDFLFQAMNRLSLITGGPRKTEMGWGFDLICPWVDEHTERATTGTVYVPGNQHFKCHHGHCVDRNPGDLKVRLDEMLREDSSGLVGIVQVIGEVEFDVVDPATVELPDILKRWDGEFFARYVWLGPKDGFWDMDRQVLVHDRTLNSAWTHRLGKLLPLVGEGKRRHPMPPAVWFLRDRRGRHVDGLIRWPEQPAIVRHNGQTLANRWRPTPRPLRGTTVGDTEVQPWLDLYWHVIGGETPDAFAMGNTVLDWLAMVAGSSVKGGWQVLVLGKHGIGKEMIVAPLIRGLGARAHVVQGDEMNGGFSGWLDNRFVSLPDIKQTTRGTTSPHDQMARLKGVFDRGKEWLTINVKFMPQYEARNEIMGWLASNEDNPLRLEEGDRRFLVLNRRCVDPWPDAAYLKLGRWFEHENGYALVTEWLIRRWETMPDQLRRVLTGVAPMTQAKAEMIAENEDPVNVWFRRCVESEYPEPDALPDVVSVDFVIERMLQAQREGWFNGARVNANPINVGRRLAKMGAEKLNDGNPITVQGRRTRAWAIRNIPLYIKLVAADLSKICDKIGLGAQMGLSH